MKSNKILELNEQLKNNKIFRSMWADDYSTVDDMEERFKNELTGQVGDSNLLRIEIRIAINTLDMEMREAFLTMNYNENPKIPNKEDLRKQIQDDFRSNAQ